MKSKTFKVEWDNEGLELSVSKITGLIGTLINPTKIGGTTLKVKELPTPMDERFCECEEPYFTKLGYEPDGMVISGCGNCGKPIKPISKFKPKEKLEVPKDIEYDNNLTQHFHWVDGIIYTLFKDKINEILEFCRKVEKYLRETE